MADLHLTAPSDVHQVLGQHMLADGLPLVYDPVRSHDAFIVDARTGEEFLDLFSFFASMPVGHNHPGLRDPVFREKLLAAALSKPSNSDLYTVAMADFVRTFARTVPPEFAYLFFIEGGALAVENALKVAFDWKVRKNIAAARCGPSHDPELGTQIIHFRGAFHGRSGYTLSLTNGASIEKTMYFPKFPWPRVSTPGIHFTGGVADDAGIEQAEAASLAEVHAAIDRHGHDVAAIIIETIQGEGGDVHFRPEFLAALRRICDAHEILLVFDEIQSGMGLTGTWWAFQQLNVQPDVFAFGKKSQVCGIAGNHRTDDVDSVFKVSSRINSTWGGNLVDMVRCTRYIEIIEAENLIDNAARMGAHLIGRLRELEARYPIVSNTRGRGLMCAFDLPDTEMRNRFRTALATKNVLGLSCGPRSIRFRPTLDVRPEHLDLGIDRIQTVLGQM